MVDLARALRARGLTVWLAGGAAARIEESLAAGAALNVWDADPTLVADRAQGPAARRGDLGRPAAQGRVGPARDGAALWPRRAPPG